MTVERKTKLPPGYENPLLISLPHRLSNKKVLTIRKSVIQKDNCWLSAASCGESASHKQDDLEIGFNKEQIL